MNILLPLVTFSLPRENWHLTGFYSHATLDLQYFLPQSTMSFLDNFKAKDKKKKNENPLKNVKNPFAQVGKAMTGQNRKFAGQGESLGGSRPGKLLHMTISEDGPVGVKVSSYIHVLLYFFIIL